MPKTYRLTGEEIRSLSRSGGKTAGKRIHGTFFSLRAAPISGDRPKFALVVSAKVASRAVDRNKLKRRARSVLAKRLPRLKTSVALIFYAKREAKDASFSEIAGDLEALCSKL